MNHDYSYLIATYLVQGAMHQNVIKNTKERIISKMVQTKLVPEGWIDSVEIIDYAKNGYRIPSMDPISLFMRPSFTLTLLSDSAICFGAKFLYDSRPKFSDPRFRLPAYRGVIYKFQGSASDEVNLFLTSSTECFI